MNSPLNQENLKQLELARIKAESKLVCKYKPPFLYLNTEKPEFIKDEEEVKPELPVWWKEYTHKVKCHTRRITIKKCEERTKIANIILQSISFIGWKSTNRKIVAISNFKPIFK